MTARIKAILDAAAVAAGLTENTRQFMLSPLYSARSEGISAAWFHDTRLWAGRVTAKLGLVTRRRIEPGYFASIPTPLGLAVRAILLEMKELERVAERVSFAQSIVHKAIELNDERRPADLSALIERLTRAASIIVSMVDAGTLLVENDLAEAAMDELRAAYEDAKGEKG